MFKLFEWWMIYISNKPKCKRRRALSCAMKSTSLTEETWTTRQNLPTHLSAIGRIILDRNAPRETHGGKKITYLEYRVCCFCYLTKLKKSYNTPIDYFKAQALVCSSNYSISKRVILKLILKWFVACQNGNREFVRFELKTFSVKFIYSFIASL